MTRRYHELLWCWLPVSCESVPVYLSCAALNPVLKKNIGYTEGDGAWPRKIVIDAALSREEQDVTLHHEYLHCCLWGRGVLHWATEERIVQQISQVSRGFCRWPRRPRGARALEAYARKTAS